jgi:hypothetical protein
MKAFTGRPKQSETSAVMCYRLLRHAGHFNSMDPAGMPRNDVVVGGGAAGMPRNDVVVGGGAAGMLRNDVIVGGGAACMLRNDVVVGGLRRQANFAMDFTKTKSSRFPESSCNYCNC